MLTFHCSGHKNILGTHKNTIEFTKDKDITLQGDCIIGVNADFDEEKLQQLARKTLAVKMLIKADEIQEEVVFHFNPDFSDSHEVVIRKGEFNSKRTLGLRADKAAKDLSRELIRKLKEPSQPVTVTLVPLYKAKL